MLALGREQAKWKMPLLTKMVKAIGPLPGQLLTVLFLQTAVCDTKNFNIILKISTNFGNFHFIPSITVQLTKCKMLQRSV